ncbi:MAG: hypothetical protein SGCHY_005279 [Lobulomycetales sp.]
MSSLQGQQQQQQQPDTQPFSSPSTAASPRTLTGQSRAASPTQRLGGYVKFFNSSKGYGFIIPTTERYEVFVHHTAIISAGGFRSLCEGEYVEFDVMQGPKGMQAANVSGYQGAPVQGDPKTRSGRFNQPSGSMGMPQQQHQPDGFLSGEGYVTTFPQQSPPPGYPQYYWPYPSGGAFPANNASIASPGIVDSSIIYASGPSNAAYPSSPSYPGAAYPSHIHGYTHHPSHSGHMDAANVYSGAYVYHQQPFHNQQNAPSGHFDIQGHGDEP